MDSISNIHRRSSLLFHLPTAPVVVALAVLTSSLLITPLLYQGAQPLEALQRLVAVEGLLFASVLLERVMLRRNPVASVRRLTAVSTLSNLVWLVTILAGLAVAASMLPQKLYAFLVFGMFFAAAFRLFVFASVFFDRLLTAFPASFLQPLMLGFAVVPDPAAHFALYMAGFVAPVSVLVYLALLDRSGRTFIAIPTFRVLKAFLQAWVTDQPQRFEEALEAMSSPARVKTGVIALQAEGGRSALVIPEVHPGPFHSVGSSNLPFQLYEYLSRDGRYPFVFHGISGHHLNLPSQGVVQKYLSSLDRPLMVEAGGTCTHPITISSGRATVTGMALGGAALLILTLSPHGMEDFSEEVGRAIRRTALTLRFKEVFIIDAHNSMGGSPSEEDNEGVIRVAGRVLEGLRALPQHPLQVGFAHSREYGLRFDRDMGPGGLGVVVFKAGGRGHALVVVDANNMMRSLRERVMEHFQASGTPVLELCTSDTHYAAGKAMNAEGYLAFGEKTGVKRVVEVVGMLMERALQRVSPAAFQAGYAEAFVKVWGSEPLNNFSAMLDRSLSFAKRGAGIVALVSLLALFVSLIL